MKTMMAGGVSLFLPKIAIESPWKKISVLEETSYDYGFNVYPGNFLDNGYYFIDDFLVSVMFKAKVADDGQVYGIQMIR